MNKFSQRIKELRINKKIKQKEIAEYLGMSLFAYQRYEYGEREPNFDKFIKLCDYFQVSADYLLGLSDVRERK
ncbi:MAG: helix-turn-helix domain-containing protein [Oscillospiraceae bacterium]|nr:helix-turn-helix domain-containing protein [Oscillospiraceae bacterium]